MTLAEAPVNALTDEFWLDRESELKAMDKVMHSAILTADPLWDIDPAETELEIQWHTVQTNAREIALEALRNGQTINPYSIAKKCGQIIDTQLERYTFDGQVVLPSMIVEYTAYDLEELTRKRG